MERCGWAGTLVLVGAIALAATTGVGCAQEPSQPLQLADAGPRFLSAPSPTDPTAPARDVRNAAVFRRRIAIDFHGTPLGSALAEIAEEADLHLTASPAVVPVTSPVSFSAPSITVGAALTAVLYDVGVDVQLSSNGVGITLIPRTSAVLGVRPRGGQSSGQITGRVTDAKTGQPLSNATVTVEATNYRATTKNDGEYRITGVAPGAYRVAARLLGYTLLSQPIEVHADSVAHADFTLAETAATLEQIVTTGAGEQRRLEVGNDITTINADSVAQVAPITELTDVLSGRAPGVEVLSNDGMVGGGVRIRIRGLSSLQLSNDPIIYIDGVRVNSNPGGGNPVAQLSSGYLFSSPSRLNDIAATDIESIEVLKGPSAASEYGTDAANGVIVIRTKHGSGGPARWDVTAEDGISNVPTHEPLNWYGWGHTTGQNPTAVECPLTSGRSGPTVGNGGCALDSVTTFQPLDHAATTAFGTGYRQKYGIQVSGGANQLRYFLSGTYGAETGPLQPPPVALAAQEDSRQAIPSYVHTPNTMGSTNLRGRFAIPLGSAADLGVTASYISNLQRSFGPTLIEEATAGPGYRDAVNYGYSQGYGPVMQQFYNTASEGVSRFSVGLTGNWRPAAWLTAHATAGVDASNQNDLAFRLPGADPTYFTYFGGQTGAGYRGDQVLDSKYYTVDLGATASVTVAPSMNSKTTVGAQYNRNGSTGTSLMAYGTLNNTLNGASTTIPAEIDNVTATLGSYIEETVSFRDRLFVTGALRGDAGSGFGTEATSALYPKASASWIAWQTSDQSVRLRAAYGASGVQPRPGATLALYSAATLAVGGAAVAGDTAASLANPRLKPERQTEFEGGVDATNIAGRVDLDLTYYTKLSRDALVSVTLPGSAGALTEQENVGSIRNFGVEGTVTTHILDTRFLSWDVTLGGSLNHNRLVSLANGVPPIISTNAEVPYRDVVGYPTYGYWAPPLLYTDANHDGILEPNEVSVSNTPLYVGSPLPTQEMTVSINIGLFRNRLRLYAQVDHRGGFTLEDYTPWLTDVLGASAADLNDRHLPLRLQARAIETQKTFLPLNAAYFENGTFTRLREISAHYLLPDGVMRAMRVRSASLTVSGRNLALWTRYRGADPEVNTAAFTGLPLDASTDAWAMPLLRYWTVRVDLGL